MKHFGPEMFIRYFCQCKISIKEISVFCGIFLIEGNNDDPKRDNVLEVDERCCGSALMKGLVAFIECFQGDLS